MQGETDVRTHRGAAWEGKGWARDLGAEELREELRTQGPCSAWSQTAGGTWIPLTGGRGGRLLGEGSGQAAGTPGSEERGGAAPREAE